MPEINPIHTPCKQCVFAKYENITQTDCFLNYIDKYKTNEVEILEAYDEEKEFYIINGKKCIGYRENKWFANIGMENASIEEKIQEFNRKNYLHYLLVLNLDNYSYENFEHLKNQIANISIKPSKIIFIRYQNKEPLYGLDLIKNLLEFAKIECKWRVQTMVDESIVYDQILHNVINMNKKYRFLLSVRNHCDQLNDIVSLANKKIYDELDRFTIISDKHKNAELFSTPSYRFYLTVEGKSIFDYPENYTVV